MLEIKDLTECLALNGHGIPEVDAESPKITLFGYLRTMFEEKMISGEFYLSYLRLLVDIPSPSEWEQRLFPTTADFISFIGKYRTFSEEPEILQ